MPMKHFVSSWYIPITALGQGGNGGNRKHMEARRRGNIPLQKRNVNKTCWGKNRHANKKLTREKTPENQCNI